MSITLTALLVVAAAVAATLGGRAVLVRLLPPSRVVEAQPTADIVMEAMAGLYGVLVAFILAGAWEQLNQARAMLTAEAHALADLRQIARMLPAPVGDELGRAVEAYRRNALEALRTATADGSVSETEAITARLWRIAAGFETDSPAQLEWRSRALDAVEELEDQRRALIRSFSRTVPKVVWAILIVGAAAVLLLAGGTSIGGRLAAAYLTLLAAVISLALFTIWALSQPVRSGLAREMSPLLEQVARPPPDTD